MILLSIELRSEIEVVFITSLNVQLITPSPTPRIICKLLNFTLANIFLEIFFEPATKRPQMIKLQETPMKYMTLPAICHKLANRIIDFVFFVLFKISNNKMIFFIA